MPKVSHRYYRDLDQFQQLTVCKLASLIRLADGLDRKHGDSVDSLNGRWSGRKVFLKLKSSAFSDWEKKAALKKAGLFQKVFWKEVEIVIEEL
jgi:exopolyphosphatase/guanosine-5'-triphosphate,3'-diphosphate pyrophosphatase